MLSRQSCILDSLPCIPDSKWILDSNLKFQISQAKFSWILDAPIFFPHSGIRSPLHGATRPYHFTLAFIRPGWLSSTNSSLLSTSPYLQSKERLFFENMPGILFALRWYTIRIVRFILSWWPHGCCCFFFCQVHRRWNQHGRGPPFYWEGPFYSNNKTAHIYDRHRFSRDLHSCCLAQWSQPLFPGLIM